MAGTLAQARPVTGSGEARRHVGLAAVPWFLWAVLFASTSVMIGVVWDISWHMTIGRDTFWTPAHLAIYAGGVVAGLACGYLALHTTFAGAPAARGRAVTFWRVFQAPLGAWVCIWGAMAMITSGPFDDWWHGAYGLDVEILSPPHVVLALGIIAIQVGAMLMVLARQNRGDEGTSRLDAWLFAYAAAVLLVIVVTMVSAYIEANNWHRARTYKILGGLLPLFLVATARAGRLRWPATTAAAIYMGSVIAVGWVLQLFPAQPLLAPIYNPVTHMVPPDFPLLLVIPAVGVDVILQRMTGRSGWIQALVVAPVFLTLLIATHWFWGEFMLSPWARNYVFMGDQWAYQWRLGPGRYGFWDVADDPLFSPRSIARISALGFVSTRVGLWWGEWMARVRR